MTARRLRRLLELSGDDVGRLRADVEKLLLFAAGQPRITLDHVSAVVGAPVYHGDDWALVRAIERGDAGAALRELAAALEHGGVPFQILGSSATPYGRRRRADGFPPGACPRPLTRSSGRTSP